MKIYFYQVLEECSTQRENRRRESLEKFITLHKARIVLVYDWNHYFGLGPIPKPKPKLADTLYNVILRIARNLLETRENIKIESHPFYHIICDWGDQANNFYFFWKKIPKCPFFKMAVFQNLQFSNFFSWKFHGLVLGLVGLIDAKGIDVA